MSDSQDDRQVAEKLRRQRESLADFGLQAFRTKNLDQLLHRAAEQISVALDIRFVKVLELLPGGRELLVRAGVNWKPGVVGQATIGADSGSPGGYALRRDEAVISHDLATETRFRIPELLVEHGVKSMVNVIIAGEGEAFGVLEVDAQEHRPFDQDDITFLRSYANLLAAAVDRIRSHDSLTRAAGEREFLLQELRHRVKNLLALVQSLVTQTGVGDRSAEEYREALLGRLRALARAEDLVFEIQGDRVGLIELVEGIVEPYRADRPEAVSIEGVPVSLAARQAMMLGLALHELGTTASKYGSLSTSAGSVHVSWRVEEDDGRRVQLVWQERGGPPVEPPENRGFGTRVIERVCARELDGETNLNFAADGLSCHMWFPVD